MIKLPEPVAVLDACQLDRSKQCCRALHCTRRIAVHTEAHLKQAVKDAYEEAAKVCEKQDGAHDGIYADAIRALIKEIPE